MLSRPWNYLIWACLCISSHHILAQKLNVSNSSCAIELILDFCVHLRPSSTYHLLITFGWLPNNLSNYRMDTDTPKLFIRVFVGRVLWISNRVSIRAIELSNSETFRILKISHRFWRFHRALKLSKQATQYGQRLMILNRYIWVQPLPPSDRFKNV